VFRDAVCAGGRDRASGGFGIDVVGLVIRGPDDVLNSADWERRRAGQAADGDYVELPGAHTFSRGHPSAS
jgi:hypothetical protein